MLLVWCARLICLVCIETYLSLPAASLPLLTEDLTKAHHKSNIEMSFYYAVPILMCHSVT